jgi:hypothetical protein
LDKGEVMGDYRIGSWEYMSGCFYVVVNTGGTMEKHGRVAWYKRLWLEILECLGKPMSLLEVRKFIK